MTFTTYTEAENRAKELGAVRVGIYRPVLNSTAFSAHFFDSLGLEIGFYHYDLHLPLFELSQRRAWHPSFLNDLDISEVTA